MLLGVVAVVAVSLPVVAARSVAGVWSLVWVGVASLLVAGTFTSAWGRWRWVEPVVTVGMAGWLVAWTGGLHSPFVALWFLYLLSLALVGDRRQVLVGAALVAGAVIGVAVAEPPGAHEVVGIITRGGAWAIAVALPVRLIGGLRSVAAVSLAHRERYAALHRLLPDPAFVLDTDLRLTDANRAAVRLSGFSIAELQGRLVSELVAPAQVPRLTARLVRVLDGATETFDLPLRTRDGTKVIVNVSVAPLRLAGSTVGIIGVGSDVTAERAAHRELARFREVFDALGDGVMLLDTADHRCLYANVAVASLLQQPLADLVGHEPYGLWPELTAEHLTTVHEQLRAGDHPTQDLRLEDSIFELRWQLTQDTMLLAVREVTEARRAEQAVRRSEAWHRSIARSSEGAIYEVDLASGRLMGISEAIEPLTGYPADRFNDDPGFVLERIDEPSRELLRRMRRGELGDHGRATLRFRTAEGTWTWLEDRFSLIRDDHDRIVGVQGMVFDVTAREKARAALEAALRHEQEARRKADETRQLQELFLQAISHELRTPLTAVLGFAYTLERHGWIEGRTPDLIARLRHNAEKLQRLLDDLLDLNCTQDGSLQLDRSDVDLLQLCRDVAAELDIAAVEPRPIQIQGERRHVEADPVLVRRTLWNLLHNAVKFSPPDTTVQVHVDGEPALARIRIADRGPGIPDTLKREIFTPFRQGPEAARAASPGTGIGLSLAAQFAAAHGGAIRVEDRPAGGSVFVLELPARAPSVTAAGDDDRNISEGP